MNELKVKEYLDKQIEFKMINGEVYANANSMAETQKLKDWKRSKNTTKYLTALEVKKNNGVENSHTRFIISESGLGTLNGTWIHEKLILSLARYISVEFEIWCDEQIATLLREGQVSIKQRTEESMLEELFPTSDKSLIKLTAEQIRTTKQLLITTAELKPKADLIDYLSAKQGSLRFQEMAQLLKMSKSEFEYKLKRLRILKPTGRREVYSDYHVTRKYFEKGLSEVYAEPTWYVTQKGSVWLAKKFKEMDEKKAW